MEDNSDLMAHECDYCGEIIESPMDMAGDKVICPNCDRSIFVPSEEDSYDEDTCEREEFAADQTLLFDSNTQQSEHPQYSRKRGWLKNLVAILIGIITGIFFRVIIGIPLVLIFATDEGLPLDITFILEVLTAFLAGAMAGSLVPRFGWLVGGLTQLLKIIVIFVTFGLWTFLVVTDSEVDLSLNFIREPNLRLMIMAIIIAGTAGMIGQKFRKNIWAFLGTCFGFIAGTCMIVVQVGGSVLYLYFLYRGGKALFEEGAILKALLWWVVIGPLVSYGSLLLIVGIIMGGGWIFEKIYNWYLPDLGFEEIEDWY